MSKRACGTDAGSLTRSFVCTAACPKKKCAGGSDLLAPQGASCCKSTDLGERLLKVVRMDWIHIPKILAIAAAIIVCVGALIFATMSWLLNHPKD